MTFTATHVVPSQGLPTWPAPDLTAPTGPPLAAGLPVQLLEVTAQGWAHVACSNGWTAWVDARHLTQSHSRVALVKLAMRTPVTLGPLSLAGAAGIAGASFLPWFSGGGESVSAWDIALHWVLFGTGDGTSGIRSGLPLVLAAGALALLVLMRQAVLLPVAIAFAAVGSWTAVFAISRVLRPDGPEMGIGIVAALVGAALVGFDAFQFTKRMQAAP